MTIRSSLVVLALAGLLVVACAEEPGGSGAATVAPSTEAGPTEEGGAPASEDTTTAEPAETTAPAAFESIALKGKGSKVAKFTIPEGAAAIATISHNGKSNFSVEAIDDGGDTIALLVNEIGDYAGTVLFDAHEGEHSVAFKITADGSWKASIVPVAAAKKWDPSTVLKGKGDAVYQVSPTSSGLVTVDMVFKGDGNFAVTSYSADGAELLANEIDDFKGQTLLPDGTFLVEITADGSWSLTPG